MLDGKNNNTCYLHSGIRAEIDSMKNALDLARRELDRRLEGMNEFREQLKNQASTFLIRESYDISHKTLEERVRNLEVQKSNLEGRLWIIPTIIVIIQIALIYIIKMSN